MGSSDSFYSHLKDSLKSSLSEAADKEIDRLTSEFRERLEDEKTKLVDKIVNSVDIVCQQGVHPSGSYIIQINVRR